MFFLIIKRCYTTSKTILQYYAVFTACNIYTFENQFGTQNEINLKCKMQKGIQIHTYKYIFT